MIEVKFDRNFYPIISEMCDWCEQEIGSGRWYRTTGEITHPWEWQVTFGYSTFYFRSVTHASMFILRWKK